MIRAAKVEDASRIAEILIFSKRLNYRNIFKDDKVSFGEMQVYPLAESFIDNPLMLEGYYVYDDEFVKGVIHVDGNEIIELYVDSFFTGFGIGGKLIEFALNQKKCNMLWVLEENFKAIHFYEKHGFSKSGEKKLEDGTSVYAVKMCAFQK